MNQLDVWQAAYLAGAIDGEGNLSVLATNQARQINAGFQARIQISNVQLEWLETLQSWVGGGHVYRLRSEMNNKRACYYVRWTGAECQRVLSQVMPFLLIKQAQGHVMAAFFETAALRKSTNVKWQASDPDIVKSMWAIHAQMKSLNARGLAAIVSPRRLADSVRTCSVDGCDRRHYGKGYCKQHYKRYIEHGGFTFYEKQCVVCGRTFTARRSDTVTCTKPCSDRNQYLKNQEARNAYKRAWRAKQQSPSH